MSTLDFRCSSHVADRSLKRIAKSESMSVEEVKSLYLSLRSVVSTFIVASRAKSFSTKHWKWLRWKRAYILYPGVRLEWVTSKLPMIRQTRCWCRYTTWCIPVLPGRRRGISYLELKVFIYSSCSVIFDEFYVRYLRPVESSMYCLTQLML